MRVPRAAAEMAAAALTRLDPAARARAELPATIAAGNPLQPEQAATIAEFWAQPRRPDDPSWRLASALLGGTAMHRTVTAAARQGGAPAEAPHTGAMTAALLPALTADQLAVADGLPVDDLHITLLYHGDVAERHPLEQVEAAIICTEVAARWLTVPVEFTHIAHMGPPDDDEVAVALEMFSPTLHSLRRELRDAFTRAGVFWSDTWAFRPHTTITWLPRAQAAIEYPPGPLPQPITSKASALLVAWGDARTVIPLSGTDRIDAPPAQESPVSAAAGRKVLPALNEALSALTANLRLIDDRAATAVATAVQMAYTSALDRIGRMVTRAAADTALRSIPPAEVAVTAAAADLDGLNVRKLIEPAIADAAAHVRRVLAAAQLEATAAIADTFAVDLDDLRWPDHLDAAVRQLEDRLRNEVLFRAGVTDAANIDPAEDTGDPLQVPFGLVRDVLAIAGGADHGDTDVVRDMAGRPLMGDRDGTDGVALGPYALSLVADAMLAAGEPEAVTAEARRRPGALLSDRLKADLAQAAEIAKDRTQPPSGMVTVYTWRGNYNGVAQTNLPEHEALWGTEVLDAREFDQLADAAADINEWPYTGRRYPGDHARCHCGWEPRIEYRIITP